MMDETCPLRVSMALHCPDDRVLQLGARCLGGDDFQPLTEGSEWGLELAAPNVGMGSSPRALMRLRSCPVGHVLVRSDAPGSAERDQCVQCKVRMSAVGMVVTCSERDV